MSEEQDCQWAVGAHCDGDDGYAFEIARLETLGPVERTMSLPEALGCCEHFLHAGRKL
jgi:hypothetical protein